MTKMIELDEVMEEHLLALAFYHAFGTCVKYKDAYNLF